MKIRSKRVLHNIREMKIELSLVEELQKHYQFRMRGLFIYFLYKNEQLLFVHFIVNTHSPYRNFGCCVATPTDYLSVCKSLFCQKFLCRNINFLHILKYVLVGTFMKDVPLYCIESRMLTG